MDTSQFMPEWFEYYKELSVYFVDKPTGVGLFA